MFFKAIILFALSMTTPSCSALGTTPQGSIAAAIDCAAPALVSLIGELIPQVTQKLEGGSPNWMQDLQQLEGQTPAAVACAVQQLTTPTTAAPSGTAVSGTATSTVSTTSIHALAADPAATPPAAPAPPRLSDAACARGKRYLQKRGFRFRS